MRASIWMMSRSRRKDQPGYTLLEIILAILVLSIAVVGISSAISFTTAQSLNAEVMSTAKELAQEGLEELIAAKRTGGFSALTPVGLGAYGAVAGFPGYTRRSDICYVNAGLTPKPNPPPPASCSGVSTNYKQLTVSVQYQGLPSLASPVVSLITVVTNVGE